MYRCPQICLICGFFGGFPFDLLPPRKARGANPQEGTMALQFKVSDLNTVPEALRSLYVQKDNVFVLDVEGGVVPESDIEGLKKTNVAIKAEKQKLIDQMNGMLKSKQLSDDERTQLKARVDELESQVMTKEELAAKAVKKARDEAEADKAKIRAEADQYKKLFTESTVKAALFGAAQEAGAYSAEQVHGLLAGRTILEPVLDDEGKPTGQYVPKTTVHVLDGDKRVEKTLPASEAVKAFLELPENKNLVNTSAKAGGGARASGSGTNGINLQDLAPTERIIAARKAGIK
jgi:hypothetical protein